MDRTLGEGLAWHRVRVQVFPDGGCGVALDGRPLWVSTGRLVRRGAPVILAYGMSYQTELLIKEIESWEGIRGGVDWTRAPTTTEFSSEEAEGFEDAELLRDIATPDAELQTKQIAAAVNKAVQALPEELRTAITLREIEGLSYEEIAQMMNCPIGTVRSRIFRAREAIAEKIRPMLGTGNDKRW